jgi:hypothetical protein
MRDEIEVGLTIPIFGVTRLKRVRENHLPHRSEVKIRNLPLIY